MAEAPSEPKIGELFEDRYVLEQVLGRGGMGVVFAARHTELGEQVAIKILHPEEALDEEHLERFLREARLAARIKNEHVVRIIDVARGRGQTPPYIVMEYLDGFDLAQLLRARGPLPEAEAIDYVLQACEAVGEAHTLGIVHRDLKPSNLMLTRRSDGTPLLKVLDFGISKTDDADDASLTKTNAVFGSPAYMSPEQIRSARDVDERSDVWSLAVVLFELITGRLPFSGQTTASILAAIAADTPISLTELAPKAPPALARAIEACLAKDRDQRVPTVTRMAELLAPFASAAGRASIEALQRLARSASGAFSAIASGSLPLPAGIPVDGRSDPRVRTDRAIVVSTDRSLKSPTLLFVVSAALGTALVISTAMWIVPRLDHRTKLTHASEPDVKESPAPSVTPAISASPTPSVTVALSAPPVLSAEAPRPSAPRPPPPPPTIKTAKPRPNAAPAPPPPASSPAPRPAPPHVDTDSRQ